MAQEFIIKEVTGIVRLQDNDPTKIIYLNVKAFLFVNKPMNDFIEPFETEDVMPNIVPTINISQINNLDKSKCTSDDSGSEELLIIMSNRATPWPSKNKKASLSNMNATLTQQNFLVALGKNPIPNMTNEQPAQD
ncbi:2676_t:CDS:2 [Gigaspora rosea]|nr:2676_t:CDS:2 [Gigaspora rosea]